MEDGDGDSSGKRRSIIATLSDGMEMVKRAFEVIDTLMKFETIEVKASRLKRKLDVLKGKEDDINEELKYANSLSLKRRRSEVDKWLDNVGEVKVKFHQTEQEVQEKKGYWLFPSPQLHQNLDRLTTEVGELNHQCEFSRGLTLEGQERRGITFITTNSVGRMFEQNKKTILELLRDNDVLSIGVYGMGGVGKTTLLTHVNNKLIRDCQDIYVAWVTVSQKFTVRKLQDDIASALMFSLFEDDERKRAAELSDFIGKKRNLVLILDDVWEDINLLEVGLNLRVDICKLILTTRSFDVCRKMDCQKRIRVVPLSENESWELFRDKLGDDIKLGADIEEVASSLVKECAGLPLGIITMARSMKEIGDMFEWKNALETMKESKLGNEDMETKVYQVLKYSYDMLKDQTVQRCFLDCSLYPEDYPIEREVLIDQFIDERLLVGMKSRQAEIYRGETILNKLVNACLLENFENRGTRYVQMHDLVRDMALQITSTSPHFLVEVGLELKEIPDEEKWEEDLIKVSLMDNSISIIHPNSSPKCPKLSTLILKFNMQLTSIEDSFFEHMVGLSVLDLSYTDIESLPSSLFKLVNLTALLLKRCQRLKYLPSMENLGALRRLDLSNSGIVELPLGIESLLNLRYLHIFTSSLQIAPGVLANLTRLQFLILDWHSSEKMRVEGDELARLRRLEILKAQLYDVKDLNTYVKSLEDRELIDYTIQVGFDENSFWKESEYTKIVFVIKSEITKNTDEEYPLSLPQGIQFLCIESCRLTKSLSEATSLDNATNLRACHVIDCDGIKYLLSIPSSCTYRLLQSLEELKLQRLKDFKGLVNEERILASLPPIGTFSSIKDLIINGCPTIKKLFTPPLVSFFQNLERMRVMNCDTMEEIVASGEHNEQGSSSCGTTQVNLPKLKLLDFAFLPELKSVCSLQMTLVASCLEEIHIHYCANLKKLSFLDDEMCSFPCLRKIRVKEEWWDSLEWEHAAAKDVLRPLCRFSR